MRIRMISTSELVEVAERYRHERGEWPSVLQFKEAVKTRFHHLAMNVSNDRARSIVNDLRLLEVVELEPGIQQQTFVPSLLIKTKAAEAAKRRREKKKRGSEGDALDRVDDIRELLTEAMLAASSGKRVDEVVPVLMGRFQLRESARMVDEIPAPIVVETPDIESADPALGPIEPSAAPDCAPDRLDETMPQIQVEPSQRQLI